MSSPSQEATANWVEYAHYVSKQAILLPCRTKTFGPYVSSSILEFFYTRTLSVLQRICWSRDSVFSEHPISLMHSHISWTFIRWNGESSSRNLLASVHQITSWLIAPTHGARVLSRIDGQMKFAPANLLPYRREGSALFLNQIHVMVIVWSDLNLETWLSL